MQPAPTAPATMKRAADIFAARARPIRYQTSRLGQSRGLNFSRCGALSTSTPMRCCAARQLFPTRRAPGSRNGAYPRRRRGVIARSLTRRLPLLGPREAAEARRLGDPGPVYTPVQNVVPRCLVARARGRRRVAHARRRRPPVAECMLSTRCNGSECARRDPCVTPRSPVMIHGPPRCLAVSVPLSAPPAG